MYPRQFSFLKSLITAGVLVVFSYFIVQANQMQVPETSHQVPYRFVATEDKQSALIELNELDLIPVEATDGVRKHVVKRGESLLGIAAYYGTTIDKIKETNNISSSHLRVGQEIYISDVQGIIHTLNEDTNFLLFANKFNLPLEDLLTLNYVTQEETSLSAGTEVFLPITIEKAYELNLEDEPEPEPIPLPKAQPIVVQAPKPTTAPQPRPQPVVKPAPVPQPIAQPAPAPKPQTVVEKVALEQQEPVPEILSCRADQCVHNDKCYDKPEFGVCAPEDTVNAWVCIGGYVDTGSTCISEEELQRQKNNIYAGKVVATWYDNSPRVSNGFYGGQCTYWAAKRRPDIFPYISATQQTRPFRGNANAWYRNAAAAGLAVGTNPAVGAVAVDIHGGGGYGHVAIVKEVRADLGLILIEDMNGASGRWFVDHRWDRISTFEGYIY